MLLFGLFFVLRFVVYLVVMFGMFFVYSVCFVGFILMIVLLDFI